MLSEGFACAEMLDLTPLPHGPLNTTKSKRQAPPGVAPNLQNQRMNRLSDPVIQVDEQSLTHSRNLAKACLSFLSFLQSVEVGEEEKPGVLTTPPPTP